MQGYSLCDYRKDPSWAWFPSPTNHSVPHRSGQSRPQVPCHLPPHWPWSENPLQNSSTSKLVVINFTTDFAVINDRALLKESFQQGKCAREAFQNSLNAECDLKKKNSRKVTHIVYGCRQGDGSPPIQGIHPELPQLSWTIMWHFSQCW